MENPVYPTRNGDDEPKRIKFLVFSLLKPKAMSKNFHKRWKEDSQECRRDIDFLYLKHNLIDKFAKVEGNDDHIGDYRNKTEEEFFDVFQKLRDEEIFDFLKELKLTKLKQCDMEQRKAKLLNDYRKLKEAEIECKIESNETEIEKQFISLKQGRSSAIVKDEMKNEIWDEMRTKLEQKLDEDCQKPKTCLSLADYDCFIFIFLTFRAEESETCVRLYDAAVPLDKVWDRVNEIESMRGKPKIFLVQADDTKLLQDPTVSKGSQTPLVPTKIPTEADRLIIIGTVPAKGYVENEDDPSFLIQAFVEVIKENGTGQNDILSLTVNINQKVLAMINNAKAKGKTKHGDSLQLPCTISTLRKRLVIY